MNIFYNHHRSFLLYVNATIQRTIMHQLTLITCCLALLIPAAKQCAFLIAS